MFKKINRNQARCAYNGVYGQQVPLRHRPTEMAALLFDDTEEKPLKKNTERAERQSAHTILTLWGGVTNEANDVNVEALTRDQLYDIALEAWNLSSSILSRNPHNKERRTKSWN